MDQDFPDVGQVELNVRLVESCHLLAAIKRSLSGDRGHTCWGWIASLLPSTYLATKLQTHLELYTLTARIILCVLRYMSFHIPYLATKLQTHLYIEPYTPTAWIFLCV